MTSDARRLKAFTLIELLIAAAIFSVVILSLYSAFQTGMLTYRKVDFAFDTYQNARLLFNRLEVDLKNAFAYADANGSRFSGAANSLDFFSAIDLYENDKAVTNICRIRYELKDKALIRSYYRGLDALKADAQPVEGEVAQNIESLTFEYAIAAPGEEIPYQWQKSWPEAGKEQEQSPNLPLAIKITLSLTGEGTDTVDFVKVIPLAVQEAGVSAPPGNPGGDESGGGNTEPEPEGGGSETSE